MRRASGRPKASYRWRTARLSRPLRFSLAPQCGMGLVHGVDAHFSFVPPPPPAKFRGLASSIGIGLSVTVARSLGEDAASPWLPVTHYR